MKIIKLLFIIFFSLEIISCQHELHFPPTPSTGSLKDSSGNCLLFVLNGEFFTGSSLSNDNYIDVQLDIHTTGSYEIHSDTINGFSFSGAGDLQQLV